MFKVAFVGYRDFGDGDLQIVYNEGGFTENVQEV
jgi:hypothetical protein